MTITIDLPSELERELTGEAKRLGIPLSEYALRVLEASSHVGQTFKTGAELVEYWQREGLIGTRSDITDSQEYARQLRARAEKRSKD